MSHSDAGTSDDAALSGNALPALLRWYEANRRDLPWRRSRDPYRIWLSEVMLQQTTVRAVLGYYERFLGRFPSVFDLASAELSEVLRFWEGLGYYQRARNLHRAAGILAENPAGPIWPSSVEQWQSLPGIGRSTAGAIHSLSTNLWAPILDANVRRVTERLFGIPPDVPVRDRRLWEASNSWGRENPRPADTNQALMELGATLCLPAAPSCEGCPVAFLCKSRTEIHAAKDPQGKKVGRKPAPLRMRVALVPSSGPLLFEPRLEGRLLEGLLEIAGFSSPGLAPGETVGEGSLGGWTVVEEIGRVRHVYSHFREEVQVLKVEAPRLPGSPEEALREGGRWESLEGAGRLALTGVARKIVSALRSGAFRVPETAEKRASGAGKSGEGEKGRPVRKDRNPLPFPSIPESDRP